MAKQSRKKQSGIILIELLLTSIISLLIITCLFEIYQQIQAGFQLQASLNNIQDSAQTALDILTKEIKQADSMNISESAITVRHAAYHFSELLTDMKNASQMEIEKKVNFKPKMIVMISDCCQSETFEIEKVSSHAGMQVITATLPLHHLYKQHAEVSRYEVNHFFVEKNGLYVENHHKTKMRLVDNIENLHFQSHPHLVEIDLSLTHSSLRKVWHADVAI